MALNNYPNKPKKSRRPRITVPNVDSIAISDKGACIWLGFEHIPPSKIDKVIAFKAGTATVIGVASYMTCPVTNKRLYPLYIHLVEDEMPVDIAYYCFKLNRIFYLRNEIVVDGFFNHPLEPKVLAKNDLESYVPR